MNFSRRQRKTAELAQLMLDPVSLVGVLLNAKLWLKQKDILLSVDKHRRTAVKACHASGKTFVAALIVLWWLITHPDGIVITTAPTWIQVERVLWGEIHAAIARSSYRFPKPTATRLELGPNRYAIGLSTNEGVRFQGFHGDVLVVIDEAPGVLPSIYEAIEGIAAGGDTRVLAIGNPVISSGPFHDVFADKRESWHLITISAFDTPNLAGYTPESLLALPDAELDRNPYPFLTTRRWVVDRYKEWGPENPSYQARVLGNFPQQGEDSLLNLTWLEEAKLRTDGEGDFYAGVDVAGPGDAETTWCVRQGPRIVACGFTKESDARGRVLAALTPYKGRLKAVNVDVVGIGHYMAMHLEDFKLPVNNVNVGKAAKDSDKFVNRKAELYWQFRERAAEGRLAGLTDEKTIAQLAGIRYSHNSRGQIVIESKDDARKRGVKSPDRAEAVILAFAELGLTLGYIDFLREESERLTGAVNTRPASAPTECPFCHATCIARIPNEWICNNCRKQFGRVLQPFHGPSRADALLWWDANRRW